MIELCVEDLFKVIAAASLGGAYRFDRYDVLLAAGDLLDQLQDQLGLSTYNDLALHYGLDPVVP